MKEEQDNEAEFFSLLPDELLPLYEDDTGAATTTTLIQKTVCLS